jgi:hypothetical protein
MEHFIFGSEQATPTQTIRKQIRTKISSELKQAQTSIETPIIKTNGF